MGMKRGQGETGRTVGMEDNWSVDSEPSSKR